MFSEDNKPRETVLHDGALRTVISNLFDIPLRADYRAADSSWVHVHVFLKTRLQLLTTMDESRTQGRRLSIRPP